jgi:hypothetical protein
METTREPLNLDKRSLVQWKIMGIPTSTSFILIIISFDGAFEYGGGSKLWVYVGTKAEPLCVEFCNIVQWHTFVNYFIFIFNLLQVVSISTTTALQFQFIFFKSKVGLPWIRY